MSSEEEIQIANTHIKMLATTSHQENQTNMTMRYHLTAVRMTIIKKIRSSNHWEGCGERDSL